jgi:hypothetical protein
MSALVIPVTLETLDYTSESYLWLSFVSHLNLWENSVVATAQTRIAVSNYDAFDLPFTDLTFQSVFNALSLQRYTFLKHDMVILMIFSYYYQLYRHLVFISINSFLTFLRIHRRYLWPSFRDSIVFSIFPCW